MDGSTQFGPSNRYGFFPKALRACDQRTKVCHSTDSKEYEWWIDLKLSKAQLEQYNSYNDMQQEKKELKHKIKEAKDKGESFIELQKEYDEKFGKQAQKDKLKEAEEKDKESHTKAETEYKSILGDDNDEDSEVKDTDEKDTEEE